jgi:hypothetical protein
MRYCNRLKISLSFTFQGGLPKIDLRVIMADLFDYFENRRRFSGDNLNFIFLRSISRKIKFVLRLGRSSYLCRFSETLIIWI